MDSKVLTYQVKQNILSKIDPRAVINIIDETYKHLKHKNYVKEKSHLAIEIQSDKLSSISKLSSHRQIYKAIDDLMTHIHALSIKIKPE